MNASAGTRQLRLEFPDLDLIFSETHRRLRPRTPVPKIHVQFFPFAGLNHTARLEANVIRIRLSDILSDAPPEVISSLAAILLAKLYRRAVDASVYESYRGYILRPDIQERARAARSARGRPPKRVGSRGRYVDLQVCLDRVDRQYFKGEFKRPNITWSAKRSRYILGRYDSLHHTIFVSRIFDSAAAPPYVIDYIIFHEMLHARHRSRVQDARCIVHTREFKADERRFTDYNAAKEWLKSI